MNDFSSTRRVLLFAAAGGVISRLPALPAALDRLPAKVDGHGSNLTARMKLPDGVERSITLQGVGCPVGMCSRVAIKADTSGPELDSVWMDTIAAIRETTEHDALFVMQDGSRRRLSLLHDFRVLYYMDRSGRAGKVDLAKVESLEFLTSGAKSSHT